MAKAMKATIGNQRHDDEHEHRTAAAACRPLVCAARGQWLSNGMIALMTSHDWLVHGQFASLRRTAVKVSVFVVGSPSILAGMKV